MKKWLLLALVSAAAVCGQNAKTNSLPPDPDAAWKELETSFKAPPRPDWGASGPTPEQKKQFEQELGEKSAAAAEKAQEFYTRFPEHPKAAEAKTQAEKFTRQAAHYGNKEAAEKVDVNLSEDEKAVKKLNEAQQRAVEKRPEGLPAVLKEFEGGVREVMKEYPRSAVPWQALLVIANSSGPEAQKKLLAEILQSNSADEQTVERAKGAVKALEAIGRPVELSYEATDGRKVDVQKLKGKVVLIDFWATWCPPCMAGLPEVVSLYKKYHDQGLEIVGISLDKSKDALKGIVDKYEMGWPQYFDGKMWENKFVLEYQITAVPTMWLIDKAGKLRTMQGREDMEKQVQDLLAEKM